MKKCVIIIILCVCVLGSSLSMGYAYSYAVTVRQTSQSLGFDFTDRNIKDDSFNVKIEFKKSFEGEFELSSYVWVGFEDGAFNNYDTIQIKSDNGMATGVTAECWVTNSSGGFSGYSTTVRNGQTSTKVKVQHPSGSSVTYGCFITY